MICSFKNILDTLIFCQTRDSEFVYRIYDVNVFFSNSFAEIKFKSSVIIFGIALLFSIHGLIPNFVITQFLVLPFIFLFNKINFSKKIFKSLLLLSVHSTNLLLVYMFFYQSYFKEFIYSFKYVFLIFIALVVCSVLRFVLVNKINIYVLKLLNL